MESRTGEKDGCIVGSCGKGRQEAEAPSFLRQLDPEGDGAVGSGPCAHTLAPGRVPLGVP